MGGGGVGSLLTLLWMALNKICKNEELARISTFNKRKYSLRNFSGTEKGFCLFYWLVIMVLSNTGMLTLESWCLLVLR